MTRTFICSGQSNAVGRGTGGPWDISPLVTTWNNQNDVLDATTNLGTTFKVAERETHPFVNSRNNMFVHACDRIARTLNEPVRMILVAKGGEPIAQWYSSGSPKVLLNRINAVWGVAGLAGPISGYFWHQGESDGNTGYDTYKGRFDAMLAYMQSQGIMTASTPVVIGETSVSHTDINARLDRLARENPRIEIARIKDLPTSDGTHFTGDALRAAGLQYAALWLAMIGYVPPDPDPDPEDPPGPYNTGMFSIEGGKIRITNGPRQVFNTDGKIVNLLPGKQFHTFSATFPDPEKNWIRWFSWENGFNSLNDSYRVIAAEQPATTAVKQEYNSAPVVIASQPGADFFMGHISVARTKVPSHNWRNRQLFVLVPTGVYMNLVGSLILEQAPGFCRALHVYLSGNSLVYRVQQSVGNPPDGWGWTGYERPASLFARSGFYVGHGGKRGLPIWYSLSRQKVSDKTYMGNPQFFNGWDDIKGTTNVDDPTDYSSVYQVNVYGQFGRVARF